jgi:formate dehydrogenase subunit gamma
MTSRPGWAIPTAAMTLPSINPEGAGPAGADKEAEGRRRVARFDRTERAVHWTTALLVLTLTGTGAVLYVPTLSVAVGRRLLVEDSHIYIGLALFVPLLVAVIGRWGANLRADLAQMSGFTRDEVSWLKSVGRRGRKSVGKFNPGQKLNTNAIGGLLVVLFVTGLILRWGNFLPVSIRTGATFVHDVFAVVLLVVIIGHIGFALTHPHALRSMVTGWIPERWARRHAPAWPVSRATAQKAEGPPV